MSEVIVTILAGIGVLSIVISIGSVIVKFKEKIDENMALTKRLEKLEELVQESYIDQGADFDNIADQINNLDSRVKQLESSADITKTTKK